MNIPDNNVKQGLITLTWKDLCAVNYSFNQPFCLRLNNNEVFICEKIIRIIPKKRIVVFGIWQDKPVVAKLFFDAQHAKRHLEKDIQGIESLQKNKVPTPEILHIATSIDHKIKVLILERILESKNLDDIWNERNNLEVDSSLVLVDDLLTILKSVVIEIATQHVLGLLQHDLHFKNFLLTDKIIYTLDGAQFEIFPHLLPKNLSVNNLALFLSQLGIGSEDYQEILFRHYAKARGWSVKPADMIELFFLIKKWNDLRWKNFEKKIYRNSTRFACLKRWTSFGMLDRKHSGKELLNFLSHPDVEFNRVASKLLKAGRSATVLKIKLDNQYYVVKRYNMKNVWHKLRRMFRPTRALSCWRLSHKLNLFSIATAKPVAFIEQNFLGLKGKSYFVTEYVSDMHAADYFSKHHADQNKIDEMVKRIGLLVKSLAKVEITHGDLKITNILIDENKQPVLIDLDGSTEHLTLTGLRKTWHKEMLRFLRNFDSNKDVRKKFENEFKM